MIHDLSDGVSEHLICTLSYKQQLYLLKTPAGRELNMYYLAFSVISHIGELVWRSLPAELLKFLKCDVQPFFLLIFLT